ncbi:hypothetical protein ACFLSQ_11220 [Bacteroidota bacterium]
MKIYRVFFFLLLVLLFYSFGNNSLAGEVNGDTSSVNDNKVIKVWGTHYERGYAYGYLLADEVIDILENYLIKEAFQN